MRRLFVLSAFVAFPALAQWDFTTKPCSADPKVNARFDALALSLAKKSVPEAKVTQSCLVLQGTAFVKFEKVDTVRGGVRFNVPFFAKYQQAVDQKPPTTKPEDWALTLPFPFKELDRYAPLIKQEPLTSQLLGETPDCLVERSVRDPHVIGFLCGPASLRPTAMTPTEGFFVHDLPTLEFLAHDPKANCDCPAFFLDRYMVPLSKLTPKTPGLCLLKPAGEARKLATSGKAGFLQIVQDERGREVWVAEPGESPVRERVQGLTTKCQLPPPCP